jgi:hypothetical protein
MQSKRAQTVASVIGLLLACSVVLIIVLQMKSVALAGDFRAKPWFPLVNLNHNGFHAWRLDSLSRVAAHFLPSYNFAERPLIGICILVLGTFIFAVRSSAIKPTWRSSPSITAAAAPMLILLILGLDPVVIGCVAWIPLLAVCSHLTMTSKHHAASVLALTLVSIQAALSSNQAGFVGATTAMWLAYLLALSTQGGAQRVAVTCILTLGPAIVVTLTAPTAEMPSYPRSAHVLPFDGAYGTLRPLLGPAYPFDTLDRVALRLDYGTRSLALLFLSTLAFWFRKLHQTPVARYTGKVGFVLALMATLNTCLPEPWATISPLPSLGRLLPWGTTYSITSIALGLSAWLSVASLMLTLGSMSLIPLSLCVLYVSLYGSTAVLNPVLRGTGAATDETLRPLILSPSAAIFRTLVESGLDINQQLDAIRQAARIPAKDGRELGALIEMQSAHTRAASEQLQTAEGAWRWSTRTGSQRGDEVLTVRLNEPLNVRGIELDPGTFFTDYPRGLRITGGSCDPSAAHLLAHFPVWQGSLHVLQRGIPYYAPRNEVRVVFPEPATVSCLFVHQTAQATFDWSVSRVRLLLANGTQGYN